MTSADGGVPHDAFGLRAITLDDVRARAGAKWQQHRHPFEAWVADMDFPIAPAIRERLVEIATGDVGYPVWSSKRPWSPAGDAFVERMAVRHGWEIERERCHELSDVVQGVRIAVQHLTDPGDGIVLHTPAYHPFLETIEALGRHLVAVPYPFDHDELDDRLASSPARLWILCHPHNPTGHVFSRRELERIAEVAARHDLTVVSDEIHADLVYAPAAHVPFASLGDEASRRTVTVTSPSKAFNLAGLRWAVLHTGDDRLQRVMRDAPSHYFGAPNVMGVAAAETAWRLAGDWLDAVVAVLDENRHALVDLLARSLPGVGYRPPDATYLAWLDCRRLGLGDDPAATFLDRGVELSPGPQFGDEGIGHVRLNFATSPQVLAATVAAMAG